MLSGMFKKASLGAVGGSGGSRSRGADLRDLVPNFVQGSDQSFRKLRANIEKEDDVFYAEQLTRVAKLGEGGFGVVYKCKLEAKGRVLEDYVVASGNMVAVKQLKSRAQILQEHLSQGAARKWAWQFARIERDARGGAARHVLRRTRAHSMRRALGASVRRCLPRPACSPQAPPAIRVVGRALASTAAMRSRAPPQGYRRRTRRLCTNGSRRNTPTRCTSSRTKCSCLRSSSIRT